MITDADVLSFEPEVRRFAKAFRNVPGLEIADLVQEGLMQLLKAVRALTARGEDIDDFVHFARRVVRRKFIDLYRRASVEPVANTSRSVDDLVVFHQSESDTDAEYRNGLPVTTNKQARFHNYVSINTQQDKHPGPLDAAITAEELRLFDAAKERLVDEERLALEKHFDGWTYVEIGKLYGYSHMRAMRLIDQAKASLRVWLTDFGVR